MLGFDVKEIGSATVIALAIIAGLPVPLLAADRNRTGIEFAYPSVFFSQEDWSADPSGVGALVMPRSSIQNPFDFDPPDKQSGLIVDAPAGPLVTNLDGVKVLGWKEPGAVQKSGFDLMLEFNGLGLQFEDHATFGYLRAGRVISGVGRLGLRFRYRY